METIRLNSYTIEEVSGGHLTVGKIKQYKALFIIDLYEHFGKFPYLSDRFSLEFALF